MSLFNLGKKKETKKVTCACNGGCDTIELSKLSGEIKNIKILGSGCSTCHKQYENVLQAVKNLNLNIEVEYITDMEKVMTYGVMSMPAIVVNDKVVSSGKLLKTNDLEKILK